MKVLQLVTCAYRGTIEEQDDTILWLTQSMRNAGGEIDVLLMGNAVNYAVRGQDASGLAFGAWRQTEPPRIDDEVAGLIAKGARVFAIEEDLAERGLADAGHVEGILRLSRKDAAGLMTGYDRVWRW